MTSGNRQATSRNRRATGALDPEGGNSEGRPPSPPELLSKAALMNRKQLLRSNVDKIHLQVVVKGEDKIFIQRKLGRSKCKGKLKSKNLFSNQWKTEKDKEIQRKTKAFQVVPKQIHVYFS